MKSKLALHLINSLLILIAFVFAFAIAELCLNVYIHFNPKFKEKLKPFLYNRQIPHPYCGYQSPIDYRGAKKQEQGEFIIVVTGGSTAVGLGSSSAEKAICPQLEKFLNQNNTIRGISRFKVVNAADYSYHTTQEKNVFMHFLHLQSNVDIFIFIDAFNNLARPLENYAFGLPLNYPGWPWIARNVVAGRSMTKYHLGKFFEEIRNKKLFKNSKILFLSLNTLTTFFLKDYYGAWHHKLGEKMVAIDVFEKKDLIDEIVEIYREDVLEISGIARQKEIKTLFVLQPLLGLGKDYLTSEESKIIEEKKMGDYSIAPQCIWAYGHWKLQDIGQDLKRQGVDFIDFTDIYKKNRERTFFDLMHLNDLGQEIFAKKLADEILKRLR